MSQDTPSLQDHRDDHNRRAEPAEPPSTCNRDIGHLGCYCGKPQFLHVWTPAMPARNGHEDSLVQELHSHALPHNNGQVATCPSTATVESPRAGPNSCPAQQTGKTTSDVAQQRAHLRPCPRTGRHPRPSLRTMGSASAPRQGRGPCPKAGPTEETHVFLHDLWHDATICSTSQV